MIKSSETCRGPCRGPPFRADPYLASYDHGHGQQPWPAAMAGSHGNGRQPRPWPWQAAMARPAALASSHGREQSTGKEIHVFLFFMVSCVSCGKRTRFRKQKLTRSKANRAAEQNTFKQEPTHDVTIDQCMSPWWNGSPRWNK